MHHSSLAVHSLQANDALCVYCEQKALGVGAGVSLVNPSLNVVYRRFLVAEFVFLVYFANLLLQTLSFLAADVRDKVEASLAQHIHPIF